MFFDTDYNGKIDFTKFYAFALALHKEVLKKEFQILQNDENMPNTLSGISAKSFAIAVLRNTQLPQDEVEARVQKIHKLYPHERINFEDFFNYNRFLMSLEDFATGLHFMERSEFKIGPNEFKHAVKITIDIELPELITDIMYNIFDFNDDGALSYREVIGIMKSRLDRGQRNHLEQKNMSFSKCIKHTGYQQRLLQNAE